MADDVRLTVPVARVLAAFLADVEVERYGLDLMHQTGLASGSLYPILTRLVRAGWLETQWEDIDPVQAGRPARRYYRVTAEGASRSRVALQALRQETSPAPVVRPAW
ncbi:PadR family transcriptional regulator [Longispora sp. NPDC051575]|uniref:PadR family transcriptional regulator n=1 Tax=Longispora sp. NPDC051575 TaxID=3154943 RepID=UPI00342200AD